MAIRSILLLLGVFVVAFAMTTACTEFCACTDVPSMNTAIVICNFPNASSFLADLPNIQANVTELHLAGTLGNITEGMFSKLPYSDRLTRILFWWQSKIDSVEPGAFNGLTNLTYLSFVVTSLTKIPTGLFNGVAKLQEFHFIGHGSLRALGRDVFSAGTCIGLVDIGHNAIESVADMAFENLGGCLKTLKLDHNAITSIQGAAFIGLDNIVTLSMSSNQNMTISAGSFYLDTLKSLALDSVFLSGESLPQGLFNGLVNLQNLTVQNGRLNSLNEDDFKPMYSSLKQINLSGNKMEAFPTKALSVLKSLNEVRLTNNKPGNSSGLVITPGDFNQLQSLTLLDLTGTNITQIANNTFKGLSKLETLDLDNVGVDAVSPGMFSGLPSLVSLELSSNGLTMLPDDAFQDLSSLERLSLTHNKISSIQNRAFEGLNKLQVLWLDYNELTTLSETCLKPVAVAQVFLHDNPWDCTCDLDPLRTWIKEHHNFTADVRCATPDTLKGDSVVTLTKERLCGPPEAYVDVGLYVGITFLVLFIVLVTAGGFIYWYQRKKQASVPIERLT